MCRVCKMSLDDEAAVLEAINEAVRNGTPQSHFESLLDRLCGTQLQERDEAVEEAWEKKYRGEE